MSTPETQRMGIDEFIESLTGYEEIAVKGAFGAKPAELGKGDKAALIRSLYFVLKRREGLKDIEAKDAALSATIGEVGRSFPDNDEPVPDDPITEAGKGEPELLLTPSSSQSSSSEPASNPPSTQP